jgi:predicted AlkP superfamily pyrophosphatase or phosphodiesterase
MVRCAPVRRIHLWLALALLVLLGGARVPAAENTVILISLDGTTSAQTRDPGLATFGRLRREGVAAERLVPAFPTNTFPNHVTFVTGVAPERHGVVNNVFADPERGRHSYENDPTWILVEPIWSLAARHGVVSAAYHWVGSEGPWTSGLGPRHWRVFDGGTPEREKVDQILTWLDVEDPAERPRLVTAWFHGTDGAGHRHGPDSEQALRALRPQDAQIGRLLEGLAARGLLSSTTLLLVSDHGMARVERVENLAAALDDEHVRARLFGGGGFASLLVDEPEEAARAIAVARGLGLEAWRREEAPAALRLGHRRFGDVVVLAPPGTAIVREGLRGRVQQLLGRTGAALGGAHGYRPEQSEMSGILLAFGAGVEPGASLGSVRAVDVAPTVLALLGIPVPDWMEGRPLLPPLGAISSETRDEERAEP